MIDHTNIEDYILSYIDGELDTVQSRALEDYLQIHPEYKDLVEEFSTYKLPKIEHTFDKKDDLLKKKKKISAPWKPLSIAAAVLILFGCAYYVIHYESSQSHRSREIHLAENTPQNTFAPDPVSVMKRDTTVTSKGVATHKATTAAHRSNQTTAAPKIKKTKKDPMPKTRRILTENSRDVTNIAEMRFAQLQPSSIPLTTKDYTSIVPRAHYISSSEMKASVADNQDIQKPVMRIVAYNFNKLLKAYDIISSDSSDYSITINLNKIINL